LPLLFPGSRELLSHNILSLFYALLSLALSRILSSGTAPPIYNLIEKTKPIEDQQNKRKIEPIA